MKIIFILFEIQKLKYYLEKKFKNIERKNDINNLILSKFKKSFSLR